MSLPAELDRNNVVDVDLGSAEFKANAHRHMAEWARRRPFYVLGNGPPQVVVGRYADVHRVFSDTEIFKSEMPRGPGWEQFNKIMFAQFVTQMDGEQHARVRRLLIPAFSSRRIEQLEDSITRIVDGMLDRIEANGPEFDGMQDYGAHLVVDALLDAMVNMDQRRKAIFVAFHDVIPGTTYVKPGESWSPELRRAFDRTMEEIRAIIEERRVSPRSDFISDLINARDQGDKLNDSELFDQIFGICGASLSATSRAAGGALHLLYTHPGQLDQLIRSIQALTLAGQPDGENLRVAIDAESDSMKDAMQISFLLETGRMAGSMALSSPDAKRQMTREQIAFLNSLLSDAKITHRDKLIRLNFTITRDMLAACAPAAPPARASKPAHASSN